MSGPLTGKVALVTGGGRRFGRGIALRLARDGADADYMTGQAGLIDGGLVHR